MTDRHDEGNARCLEFCERSYRVERKFFKTSKYIIVFNYIAVCRSTILSTGEDHLNVNHKHETHSKERQVKAKKGHCKGQAVNDVSYVTAT